MSKYKHGMATSRKATKGLKTIASNSIVQLVIGTAPVNTLENPYDAVNKPIVLEEKEEVEDYIGVTASVEKYTIMHAVHASFNKHAVAPLIVINVLNPANPAHTEAVADKVYPVKKFTAKIMEEGILLDKLVVSDGTDEYQVDIDYVASFDSNGYLVISIADDGAAKDADTIHVSYTRINPENVTEDDIIGGVTKNGVRSGVEVFDMVYPETEYIPTLVTAPYYSKYPAVAAALEAKVQKIYSTFNAKAILDIDCSEEGADRVNKLADVREKTVPYSRWCDACWPMVKSDGMILAFSAFASALTQAVSEENADIPSESISNHDLKIDGICTENGEAVLMTQDDVNDYLNAIGVVGALKLPTWKAWGNNSTAYPKSKDPIDRWSNGVAMLNYLENRFKSDFLPRLDKNINYKMIQGIVNDFNASMNALVPDYLAGGEIVFDKKKNPLNKIMDGKMRFSTRYAAYNPAEYIENEFEYDITMLETALEGGNE